MSDKRPRGDEVWVGLERAKDVRNATIEECTLLVESLSWHKDYTADPVMEIAAALRGLKDKQP